MKDGYKIVVNTAAGRRRYLQYLIPLVISDQLVDRYDLWVNTTDKLDVAFLERMAEEFPKINLIYQPEGVIDGVRSINAFYKYCCDEDTIYLKLDDDVIWLEPGFFEELITFRINNPDYFMVSPLVINNDISTYILQSEGLIKLESYFGANSYNLKWYNGYFAKELHEWFLDDFLLPRKYTSLHCGCHEVALNRYAINAVAWFGKDFNLFKGEVIGDNEEFLTVSIPSQIDKIHCFDCNTIAVHFSFSLQRKILDQTDILSRYKSFLENSHNTSDEFALAFHRTQNILIEINKNQQYILSKPLSHSYRQIVHPIRYKWFRKPLAVIMGIDASYLTYVWNFYKYIRNANRKYIVK